MPRAWSCPTHGAAAPVRWRRNGRGARARQCVLCHPLPPRPLLRGRRKCPRCKSTRIGTRAKGDGRRGRCCLDCVARWGREWRAANPEAHRQAQRRYAARAGQAPNPDDWSAREISDDDDPYIENAAALEAALAEGSR